MSIFDLFVTAVLGFLVGVGAFVVGQQIMSGLWPASAMFRAREFRQMESHKRGRERQAREYEEKNSL